MATNVQLKSQNQRFAPKYYVADLMESPTPLPVRLLLVLPVWASTNVQSQRFAPKYYVVDLMESPTPLPVRLHLVLPVWTSTNVQINQTVPIRDVAEGSVEMVP